MLGPAGGAQRRFPLTRARETSWWEGETLDHSGEHAGGFRHPGELLGTGVGAVELPAREEGALEQVPQKARAGPDPGPSEVLGLVAEDLHLEHVAWLGPAHLQRPGERMGKRGRVQQVRVAGAAAQLAIARVAQLEDHLVAGIDRGHGRDGGVPAVVAVGRALVERARAVDLDACAQSPYERPMTSSITSSVPAPIRLSRRSRQARSMPYSFM